VRTCSCIEKPGVSELPEGPWKTGRNYCPHDSEHKRGSRDREEIMVWFLAWSGYSQIWREETVYHTMEKVSEHKGGRIYGGGRKLLI